MKLRLENEIEAGNEIEDFPKENQNSEEKKYESLFNFMRKTPIKSAKSSVLPPFSKHQSFQKRLWVQIE